MPSPKQNYIESLGSDISSNYEKFFVPTIGEPLAKELLGIAELQAGQNVLDVACGTGIVARHAMQKVGKSGSVTGIDINPGMLEVARSLNSEINWQEANAEYIPFSDESFDVVICQLSLQFMENKARALEEMYRVLVPVGHLYLNLPGKIAPVFDIYAEAIDQYVGPEVAGFVRQVFSLYDSDEIHQLLNEAGFMNCEIQDEQEVFNLPAPKEFLWQYIYSTPLAMAFYEVDQSTKEAFEQHVVQQWEQFVDEDTLKYKQQIIRASARK